MIAVQHSPSFEALRAAINAAPPSIVAEPFCPYPPSAGDAPHHDYDIAEDDLLWAIAAYSIQKGHAPREPMGAYALRQYVERGRRLAALVDDLAGAKRGVTPGGASDLSGFVGQQHP